MSHRLHHSPSIKGMTLDQWRCQRDLRIVCTDTAMRLCSLFYDEATRRASENA